MSDNNDARSFFVTVENATKSNVEFNADGNRILLGSSLDDRMFSEPDKFGAKRMKATDAEGREDSTGRIKNPIMIVPLKVWNAFKDRTVVKRMIADRGLRVSRQFSA